MTDDGSGRLGASWRSEDREPGARRAKFRGMVTGLRQAYQQNYGSLGSSFRDIGEFEGGVAEAYPDATIARSKDEEMILFPSYARRHTKTPSQPAPEENETSNGTGGETIHQHWDQYIDRNAVVDVDVRGWIYSPHKGPMTRRQRLAIGIARQLAGLPAPGSGTTSSGASPGGSRSTSPHPIRRKLESLSEENEQRVVEKEANLILERSKVEAEAADRGEYSETLHRDGDRGRSSGHKRPLVEKSGKGQDEPIVTKLQKRASWNQPADMTSEELSIANANLMNRLKPFYANPQVNIPISAFFFNDEDSRQRTIYTNTYGHFALRAALDFVPTHVRVLAGEHLSATEEVIITDAKGVSLISDIDDTIKHTAMMSGAREAFRNAFVRDLEDLVVDGVNEWYNRLADLGVKFHYVSNSPWQLYPLLSRFFKSVSLPPGSVHLKQYSGMLQGIFEPVAERKKSTLDRIARDFPERKFLLVGDSGEADLEVYVDFAIANPGRVLGIFIRDVTTPTYPGFFDYSSSVNTPGSRSTLATPQHEPSNKPKPNPNEHDADLKAAIQASLGEFEDDERRRSGQVQNFTESPANNEEGDLIEFSDDETEHDLGQSSRSLSMPSAALGIDLDRAVTSKVMKKPPPPPLPKKLLALQASRSQPNIEARSEASLQKKQPPLPPRRSSSSVSGTSQDAPQLSSRHSRNQDDPPSEDQTSLAAAKQKLNSVYNSIPPVSSILPGSNPSKSDTDLLHHAASNPLKKETTASTQPIPSEFANGNSRTQAARGAIASYSAAAANRVGSMISSYYAPPDSASGSRTPPNQSSGGGRVQNNNKVELWKRRWAQAESTLKKQGLILKSWREGTDAMDESIRLVKMAQERSKD